MKTLRVCQGNFWPIGQQVRHSFIYFLVTIFFKIQQALEATVIAQSLLNLVRIVVRKVAIGGQNLEGQGHRSRSLEGQTSKSTKTLFFE